MDRDKLYEQIDKEEDMTDAEKREAYFAEIQNERDEEDWQDRQ
jgi:hypothetical protein